MAHATRNIASTSNNEDGGVNERLRSVKESLAQVTRALQEMVTMNQGINGDDVKGWIFRYEQFFSIDEIPENQKVKLISVHLFDTALLWHRQFIRLNGENVSWNVYKYSILQRFGTVYDDPISEIRKVKYQTNAKDYQDTFDTLLSRVYISEEHVSFYLGGLPVEIEMGVSMFRRTTLVDAYSLTNYQEVTLEAIRKKSKSTMTSFGGRFGSGMGQESNSKPPLLEEGDEIIHVQEELPQISLNALNRANTFQTMRVTGKVGKHEIHILVDCGSTHNFLDNSIAKRIGCPLKDTCPLAMTVGGGKELIRTKAWCEMVLCIQWGAPRTTLQWMEGEHLDKEVGRVPHAELLMFSVFPNTSIQLMSMSSKIQTVPQELQKVVDQYDDMFAVPKELPPQRAYDHIIPLLAGTPLVNVRPYRHPPTQKDAIQAMVKELLEAGGHQEQYSPFASPIVMVKNKDNTWRMCIDYMQLNKNTVKDKFSIHIIEELIDELHEDAIFSKLKRRFIKGFASLSRPLTQLLKKNAFKWTPEAQLSFKALKKAMVEAPVLGLPDFKEHFMIETDALGVGLGTVLQQNGHPIAYLNHFSLKYLLDQRITTPTEMKWLPKLMGYDYEVVYKKGSENGAANALSRLGSDTELLSINGQTTKKNFAWVNGKLLRKGKIVVGMDENLRRELLQYFHEDYIGGHSGVKVTSHRLCSLFYWKVVYGKTPPIHVPYVGGHSKIDEVDRILLAKEEAIHMIKFHLQRSQNKMKQQANKSRDDTYIEGFPKGLLTGTILAPKVSHRDDLCTFGKKLRKFKNSGLVTQTGLITVAQGCLELECLHIELIYISNEILECIGTHLKNLRDFHMTLNPIYGKTYFPVDNGIRAMLIGYSKLERLSIHLQPPHRGLTDVGLRYIGKYGYNLRYLSLGYIGEFVAGLVCLSKGCPILHKLEIQSYPFSKQTLAPFVYDMHMLRHVSDAIEARK
ncbi:retrotransposable element Tf2 [Tanacetum coccineum]